MSADSVIKFLCIDPKNCNKSLIDDYIKSYTECLDCLKAVPSECFTSTGSGKYNTNLLFCCSDCGVLCWYYFCPFCVSTRTIAAGTGKTCESVCCIQMFMFGCQLCWGMNNIRTIRKKYNIKGSMCVDCVKTMFCGPCFTLQLANQVKPGIPCSGQYTVTAPPAVQNAIDKAEAVTAKANDKAESAYTAAAKN